MNVRGYDEDMLFLRTNKQLTIRADQTPSSHQGDLPPSHQCGFIHSFVCVYVRNHPAKYLQQNKIWCRHGNRLSLCFSCFWLIISCFCLQLHCLKHKSLLLLSNHRRLKTIYNESAQTVCFHIQTGGVTNAVIWMLEESEAGGENFLSQTHICLLWICISLKKEPQLLKVWVETWRREQLWWTDGCFYQLN